MIGWIVLLGLIGLFLWVSVWFCWDGLTSFSKWIQALVSPAARERQSEHRAAATRAQAAATAVRSFNLKQAVDRETRAQREAFQAAKERIAKEPETHQAFGSEAPSPGSWGRSERHRDERESHATWEDASDRYGTAHQALRASWKYIIQSSGTDCMESICIFPTRRIKAGASGKEWDLAHDHAKGGKYDYLGPAHRACNQAEALARGVTWTGAPTLADLLEQAGYAVPYPTVREVEAGDLIRTFTDEHGGIHEEVWEYDINTDEAVLHPVQKFLGGPDDYPFNVGRRLWIAGEISTQELITRY